jgi:hypothetical protein
MQYSLIFDANLITCCSQNHKNSSTWGIPVKLILLDGQIPLVYINMLVFWVGALGLM